VPYKRSLAAGVLLLAAACADDTESPTAPAATLDLAPALAPITLVSGNAAPGGRDTENRVSVDGGTTFRNAYVVDPFTAWAPPLPGSQWITADPDFAEGGAPAMTILFRRTFTLSEDPGDAGFTMRVHADNHATIRLNGTEIGRQRFQDIPDNFNDPAESYRAPPGLLREGTNSLEIELVNFGPADPTGLDYRATIGPAEPLDFRWISAGLYHTCGVTTDDRLYCWGANWYGQLGDGGSDGSPVPVPVVGNVRASEVHAGMDFTCALTTGSRVWCWGRNDRGQLGSGGTADQRVPMPVLGGREFTSLSSGSEHSCAVNPYGRLFCWGRNDSGQLGDGSRIDRLEPVRVVAPGLLFRRAGAGALHSCAVTTDDRAYCWGRNDNGELGDGTLRLRLKPVLVAGGFDFRVVLARPVIGDRFSSTCGLTTDDRAYCWGSDRMARLGNGSDDSSVVPGPVAGSLLFDRLSVGGSHTCALTPAGAAYCWGWNGRGQLGDGGDRLRGRPTAVTGGLAFSRISAATWGQHTCAIASGGAAYCWGYGGSGQLGNGGAEDRFEPTPVAGPAE
jgi:alpha-tubulin suppressor-like RCC1 family protein